jgi:transcriptional regulator GlxA family with amidase domain
VPRPRRIVVVAFEGVQSLDVTGPSEVFSQADRGSERAEYAVELVTADGGAVRASSGLRLLPDRSLEQCRGAIDTLVVAGGVGIRDAVEDERLEAWLRLAARRSRRVTSVCTGAFLLARAGVLDGRRATTHWAACAALGRIYPTVDVDPAPIFIRDGNVYTSAGVTAGIDMALALVEEDLGRAAALQVARNMVLFVRRPGGQAQFSATLSGQAATRPGIRELQAWIADHLDADLSVTALAERAFMSPRNFARVFSREVGVTPAAYVESLRVERARTLLETTNLQVEEVARSCGFGTVETLRRAFGRHVRVSPSDYRDRFAPAQGAPVIPIRKASA